MYNFLMKTGYRLLIAATLAIGATYSGVISISASAARSPDPLRRIAALETRLATLEARVIGGAAPRSGELSSPSQNPAPVDVRDNAPEVSAATDTTGMIAMPAMPAHPHRPAYLDTRRASEGRAHSLGASPLRREVVDPRADDSARTVSAATVVSSGSRADDADAFSSGRFSPEGISHDARAAAPQAPRAVSDLGRPPRHDGPRRDIAARSELHERTQSDPRVDTPHPRQGITTGYAPAPVGQLY